MIVHRVPIVVSCAITHPAVVSVTHVWLIGNVRSGPVGSITMMHMGGGVIARPVVVVAVFTIVGVTSAGVSVGSTTGSPARDKGGA